MVDETTPTQETPRKRGGGPRLTVEQKVARCDEKEASIRKSIESLQKRLEDLFVERKRLGGEKERKAEIERIKKDAARRIAELKNRA
jgi:hypothetical protein